MLKACWFAFEFPQPNDSSLKAGVVEAAVVAVDTWTPFIYVATVPTPPV